jgi:uncharacterized membrane protein YkoI
LTGHLAAPPAETVAPKIMKALVSTLVLLIFVGLYAHAVPARSGTFVVPVTTLDSARIFLAQQSITAEEAAALVQARTGGRILAVDRVRQRGQLFYRVKVLTPQGNVQIFLVDAATGEI